MKKIKFGLLPKVAIAIALGIVFGLILPHWIGRIFIAISAIFGNFLNFFIPLLIFGLITPDLSDTRLPLVRISSTLLVRVSSQPTSPSFRRFAFNVAYRLSEY